MQCTPSGKFVGVYHEVEDTFGALTVPFFCGKWTCDRCGDKKFKKLYARTMNGEISQAIPGFRPQYSHKLLTLTLPGEEYRDKHTPKSALKDIADKWDKMNRAMKKKLGAFHYLRVVEFQKDGFPHYHVLLSGRVIVPKGILNEFRRYWTEKYGMGNIDLQKGKSAKVKKMVGYIMKYLRKAPADLPKGMRLYSASRGALSPIRKAPPKDWLCTKKLSASKCIELNELPTFIDPTSYEKLYGSCGPDIRKLLIEDFRKRQREIDSPSWDKTDVAA
jgi:hypothetical protein